MIYNQVAIKTSWNNVRIVIIEKLKVEIPEATAEKAHATYKVIHATAIIKVKIAVFLI
jgi:hypothetical protein